MRTHGGTSRSGVVAAATLHTAYLNVCCAAWPAWEAVLSNIHTDGTLILTVLLSIFSSLKRFATSRALSTDCLNVQRKVGSYLRGQHPSQIDRILSILLAYKTTLIIVNLTITRLNYLVRFLFLVI